MSKHMAGKMGSGCLFFILIYDPEKKWKVGKKFHEKIGERICERFISAIGADDFRFIIEDKADYMRYLWMRAELYYPYPKAIILLEAEKGRASLVSMDEQDLFIKLLRVYEGNPADLAVAVCKDMEKQTEHVDI